MIQVEYLECSRCGSTHYGITREGDSFRIICDNCGKQVEMKEIADEYKV